MRSVVTGLMMLAGAVVREQGQGFDDYVWRREVQGVASEATTQATTNADHGGDSAVTVIAGPAVGTAPMSGVPRAAGDARDEGDDAEIAMSEAGAAGEWGVACVRKRGGRLMFDRGSIRDLGGATLFRWAAVPGVPRTDDMIYTAVVDCRAKTIEASWPGKRSDTHAGTCGRHLVEAVCAAAPRPPQPLRASRTGN